MDLSTSLAAGLDPNLAALLGQTGGADNTFTQMLLKSVNPNASKDLTNAIGAPNLGPLADLAHQAPPVQQGYVQPALAPPQTLQALGFGMAGAAGKPGATGLSSLGEGGSSMLQQGAAASERSIREAQAENSANIAEWEGKSKLAEAGLNAQMKGPELDERMLDLTGQSLGRQAQREDTALYRQGLLGDKSAGRGIQQQNADTKTGQLGVNQGRADTYDDAVKNRDANAKAKLAQSEAALEQKATQFQQTLLQRSTLQGERIGLEGAQRAAQEFKNEMTLRKDPITGALPDESTQEALRQSLLQKYMNLAKPEAAGRSTEKPASASKYAPGQTIYVKGQPYTVGPDGDSLLPAQ